MPMSVSERETAIYTKDELLVGRDGIPNHPEPASKLIDLDELVAGDGWMRATSPSGRVDYEGVVAWTPSARKGLLSPEKGQSGDAADSVADTPEGDDA